MNTNLIILRGIPASGKSTYAKELVSKGFKRVNRDSLREMLDSSVWSKTNEKFVVSVRDHIIKESLMRCQHVVVDDTNLEKRVVQHLHGIAQELALDGYGVTVEEKWFDVPVEECVQRNSQRTGNARVPDDVIHRMAKQCKGDPKLDLSIEYPAVAQIVKLEQDSGLPHAIVVDLDGTLADNGWRNPYDAAFCDEDPVIEPIRNLVWAWTETNFSEVIFCSGREEKYRSQSESFLRKAFPTNCDWCFKWKLLMRKTGDMRKDHIIKEEIFKNEIYGKYYIEFVLDDRSRVVSMWRRNGLTCLQCARGDF